MSIKTFIHNLLHSTLAASVVEMIQKSDTGSIILDAINTAEATGKSGPEKLLDVLAVAKPLLLTLAEKGGVKAVEADVETLARNVIEAFLSAGKETLLKAIAKAI